MLDETVAPEPTVTPDMAPVAETATPETAAADTPTTQTMTTPDEPTAGALGEAMAEPAAQSEPIADEVVADDADERHVYVGDIVHVSLDRGPNTGDCRPAIVVRVWNAETINAQMFSDGLNDHQNLAGGIAWLTSLRYVKPVAGQPTPPNTWHWHWE